MHFLDENKTDAGFFSLLRNTLMRQHFQSFPSLTKAQTPWKTLGLCISEANVRPSTGWNLAMQFYSHKNVNPSSENPTKWSNTLKTIRRLVRDCVKYKWEYFRKTSLVI